MKTQQWQLRKAPEPRTLSDVESSREKPVLCWDVDNAVILVMWVADGIVQRVDGDGLVTICRNQNAKDYQLYTQPSRPTRLEDVPDRRVILCGVNYSLMMFRESNEWFAKFADRSDEWSRQAGQPTNWQLTDCVVELADVEVGVIG